SRFKLSSWPAVVVTPVRFPPGRARLATNPENLRNFVPLLGRPDRQRRRVANCDSQGRWRELSPDYPSISQGKKFSSACSARHHPMVGGQREGGASDCRRILRALEQISPHHQPASPQWRFHQV